MDNSNNQDDGTIAKTQALSMAVRWQRGNFTFSPNIKSDTIQTPIPTDQQEKEADKMNLPINSFSFNVNEFIDFVARLSEYNLDKEKHDQITGVVCWLGVKEGQANGTQPALLFEGLVGFNDDDKTNVIAGTPISQLPTLNTETSNYTARYDFSYPCPPTCAPLIKI